MRITSNTGSLQIDSLERVDEPPSYRFRVVLEVKEFRVESDQIWVKTQDLRRFISSLEEMEQHKRGEASIEAMPPEEFRVRIKASGPNDPLEITGYVGGVFHDPSETSAGGRAFDFSVGHGSMMGIRQHGALLLDAAHALFEALERRDAATARAALVAGANPNACDFFGQSALNHATMKGMPDLVESLLQRGASATPRSRGQEPPLVVASRRGHAPIVKMLLAAGAPPDAWGREQHAVRIAAELGHVHIVQLLAAAGASPDQCLVAAAMRGDAGEVARLLKQGIGIRDGQALQQAVSGRFADVIELLLNHGAPAKNAMEAAAKQGYVDAMTTLLQAGARPTVDAMKAAVEAGQLETARLLTEMAGGTIVKDSMLMPAIEKGPAELVELLLQHGVKPDQDTESGRFSNLSIAAGSGKAEVIRLLLKAGAEVDRQPQRDSSAQGLVPAGVTPLMCAAAESVWMLGGCKTLNRAPQNLMWRVQSAKSRNHRPVFPKDFAECGEILLQAGADPDAHLADGICPLLWAAYNGNRRLVVALLHHGADPNAQADTGATPLMWAADRADAEMVCALLKAGADPASQHVLAADELERASRDVSRLKLLLDNNVNRRLLRAAENGNAQEAQQMLEAGGDAERVPEEMRFMLPKVGRHG